MTGKLRVMQVILSLSPGGAQRLVIEICQRLTGSVQSTVCCLDEAGEWAAELNQDHVQVVALRRRTGFRPSLSYRIANLASEHRIDVIHSHQYSPFVYGAIATLLRPGLGHVFTEHGRVAGAVLSRKRQVVNPLLSRLGARLFAVSTDLKGYMVAEGFPDSRVGVIYNGIDPGPSPDRGARTAARRLLELPDDAYVVGTAGRLDPVKSLQDLVEAHQLLLADGVTSTLLIVGSGPEQTDLEARIRTMGTSHRVRFTGYRSDIRQLLPAFDVFVNCSTFEGVSLTILEAMAAGVPIVATKVGGTPEVVLDGDNGLLVPVRDVNALVEAIRSLASDPARGVVLGAAGRRRVERDFSIERMVREYETVYQRLARRSALE